MRVRTVRPVPGRTIRVQRIADAVTFGMQMERPDLYGAPDAATCSTGARELTCGYDELSARARARALFLDEDTDAVGPQARCSFERF